MPPVRAPRKEAHPISCFISELAIPEDGGGAPWIGCPHCRRRKDCPYVCDQALRRAARRKRTAARLLTEEAGRLLEAVSRAGDIRSLLDADEALERALECALCSEMALIRDLCGQTAEQSP